MEDTELNQLLSSIFSDETALFRTPAEPEVGDTVRILLRIRKGAEVQVSLLEGALGTEHGMSLVQSDAMFDWYETELCCTDRATVFYSFLVRCMDRLIHFTRSGASLIDSVSFPDYAHSFRLIPGFHVPEWSRGAVQYQIFPDRFCCGNPASDVREREHFYSGDYVAHAASWEELPGLQDYRCFYGGDLVGIEQKLDYLQSLGVEVLYLNPVFVSPSSHRYDTQDYEHIDPHLTVIPQDMPADAKISGDSLYRLRTTDPENLEASNAYFAHFCEELHRRGMKIILDGVFNHCGSLHRWMDKERLYLPKNAQSSGAYGNPNSPYRSYFRFRSSIEYEAWWKLDTLPKLNYEGSLALCEEIFHVAEKWLQPPYCIDGWRLDVAADLAHSKEFNHLFWKEFRRRVKAVNPQALIVAEHYDNPLDWLGGDEWDSIMNYRAFMQPLSFFLTGMEKHSDYRQDELYQDGSAFFHAMAEEMSRIPTPSVLCAMNELSNHDHSRFLTRTNRTPGRLNNRSSEEAAEGIVPAVMREAVLIQMTWLGAPTLYYGDEAGLVGWTDPDNRRTYPWGHEDRKMLEFHRRLIALRSRMPVFRNGSFKPLFEGRGAIAFARFDADSLAVTACNNLEQPQRIQLRLADVGMEDGTVMMNIFSTNANGFTERHRPAGPVRDGLLDLILPAQSAVLLVPEHRF